MLWFAKLGVPVEKNTKNQILIALSQEWPLTAKQVHNALKRQFSSTFSYQGIHKAAKELISDGVLQKIDGKLQISYEWAQNVSKFGERLKFAFDGNKNNINSGAPVVLEFNSLIDYAKFIINEFYVDYPNPGHKDCVCMWSHAYPLTGVSKEEHENLKAMFARETHWNVCGNSTFIDRVTSDYLVKLGKKVVLDSRFSTKIDTFTNGDFILQAYFEPDFQDEIENLYKTVKDEKDFDLQRLFEFCSKKCKIRVVIFSNEKFAEQLVEEAKMLYEKGGQK